MTDQLNIDDLMMIDHKDVMPYYASMMNPISVWQILRRNATNLIFDLVN